jgi:hypothetical protein
MGKLRKIGKKVKRGFSKIGKKLKKGLGKIAKAFGKLGPLGSIALSFILPGMGNVLSGWLSNMGPVGEFILGVGKKIQQGTDWVKDGVGRVFNRATDAIEYGMNAVSKPFMKEGARGAGSAFRDFVSESTSGFIDRSTVDLSDSLTSGGMRTDIVTDSNPFTKDDFIKDMSKKDLNALQDSNKFMRDINKFELKGTEGLTKKATDKGFEWYKTGDDGKLLDKPFKTITDKSLNYVPEGKQPSLFNSDVEYDSFKAKVKDSREFDAYKKVSFVAEKGQGILQDESDAAYSDYLMRVGNASRANVIANETLSVVPTNTYTYAPQEFININNLDNDSNGMQRLTAGYGMILEDYNS